VSAVWNISLPLMNSLNKSGAAIFPCSLCFLRTFLFSQIKYSFYCAILNNQTANELRKWKALRKHSLHGKIAASVLLKLFISSTERCHTTDAP